MRTKPRRSFSERVRAAAARIQPMTPEEIAHWSAGDDGEAIVSGAVDVDATDGHRARVRAACARVVERHGKALAALTADDVTPAENRRPVAKQGPKP